MEECKVCGDPLSDGNHARCQEIQKQAEEEQAWSEWEKGTELVKAYYDRKLAVEPEQEFMEAHNIR